MKNMVNGIEDCQKALFVECFIRILSQMKTRGKKQKQNNFDYIENAVFCLLNQN